MSEAPQFGPPCPGCTVEIITARIERNPKAMPTCRACRDHGALFHAQKQNNRVCRDEEISAGREIGLETEGSHGQG